MTRRFVPTQLLLVGLACASDGLAAEGALAPGCAHAGLVIAAAPSCHYGLPVIADDLVLLPKVCRHDPAHKSFDRHAVEVRALATGARVGQASLAAGDARGPAPPPAGQVLPGDPPLLVLPSGIAAIDARKGTADVVFEAQGRLLAAARSGGLLALAEALPASHGAKAAIEWTVLDLDGGAVVGQALVAGTAVRDLALVRDKEGVRSAIGLGDDPTGVDLVATIADAAGQSTVKEGQLTPRKVARALATAAAQGAGCPVFAHPDRVLVDRPSARIEARTVAVGQSGRLETWRSPPAQCLAIRRAVKGLRDVAWVRGADGTLQLVAAVCSGAPAL